MIQLEIKLVRGRKSLGLYGDSRRFLLGINRERERKVFKYFFEDRERKIVEKRMKSEREGKNEKFRWGIHMWPYKSGHTQTAQLFLEKSKLVWR